MLGEGHRGRDNWGNTGALISYKIINRIYWTSCKTDLETLTYVGDVTLIVANSYIRCIHAP